MRGDIRAFFVTTIKAWMIVFIAAGIAFFLTAASGVSAKDAHESWTTMKWDNMKLKASPSGVSSGMQTALDNKDDSMSNHQHEVSVSAFNKGSGGAWQTAQAILSTVGLTAIVIASAIVMLRIRFWRQPQQMPLMMACMGLAMAAGLSGGAILSILLASFTLPAIGSAAAAAAAGYYAGNGHGVVPAAEGLFAGIMGGLMGPMLGYMALSEHPFTVVLFSIGLFIVFLRLGGRLLREEGNKAEAGS
ncbi:hypothetical protein SAMN05444162_4333 [Paenibacillaceae bacterium GAS479]|nr:hypothetical protein SAMN05444162_4333 [Paenibacillaceae bacterium GAS479]